MNLAKEAGWSWWQWAIVLTWPAIVGPCVAWGFGNRAFHLDTLRDDVASRPPIAVIDVDTAVISKLGASATNESLATAQQSVQDAARKLRAAGYIVLDAKNVFAYPKDFEAKP